jgi:hypothetical protein
MINSAVTSGQQHQHSHNGTIAGSTALLHHVDRVVTSTIVLSHDRQHCQIKSSLITFLGEKALFSVCILQRDYSMIFPRCYVIFISVEDVANGFGI